jgi:hypothetical protein
VPVDPADPSEVLVYMATRALTFRVEVPMAVARAGAGTPTLPEAVAANIEFTLEPPAKLSYPQKTVAQT